MPRYTYNTKADYDRLYRRRKPGLSTTPIEERTLNYQREWLYPINEHLWTNLASDFLPNLDDRILIVGCGFGWSMEVLESLGYTNVFGADTSPYIQSAKSEIDPNDNQPRSKKSASVWDYDLSRPADRQAMIRDGLFDSIFTEFVLETLDDTEAQQLSSLARQHLLAPSGQIVHVVVLGTPEPDSVAAQYNFNMKTSLEDWKAVLPDDIISHHGHKYL